MACFAAPRPGELLGVAIDGVVYSTEHPVTLAAVALVKTGERWIQSVLARYHGIDARRRVSRHSPADAAVCGWSLRLRYHIEDDGESARATPVIVARRGVASYAVKPMQISTVALPSFRIASSQR